jgi:6-pyruvoyltetrahydropterin/6-carboxytetrahydropterin synthase
MKTHGAREPQASYAIAIKQDFVAQHYLISEASEPEKQPHSHAYQVEVQLNGSALNEDGYLVDIVEIESHLNDLVAYFSDKTLNDLPEFRGLNPSIEHLARIFCQGMSDRLKAPTVESLSVRIWESRDAWALYRQDV